MRNTILVCSVLLFWYGSEMNDVFLVALSQIPLTLGLALLKPKNEFANPIFLFNLSSLVTAFAHTKAFYIGPNKIETYHFFYYSSEPHFLKAMQIFWIGTLFITIGYYIGAMQNQIQLPRIDSKYNLTFQIEILIFILAFLVGGLGFSVNLPGSLSKIIYIFPLWVIFFYTRKMILENDKKYEVWIHLVIISTTVYYVLYSYLRSMMVFPMLTYLIANYVSGVRLKSFLKPKFYIYYAFFFIFLNYFSYFGESREKLPSGFQRINQIIEGKRLKEKELANIYEEDKKSSTILTRSALINQLSQIVKLTETEGFYEGQTMSYYSYAFIPRFLWPEKPLIMQGAWFAHKIGMAIINEYGRYNNSINMTVFGEFYLNFGFAGVIIGCLLFGAYIALLWKTAPIFEDYKNFMASFFGLNLLNSGVFQLAADLQAVVTVLAVYLTILSLSFLLKILQNQ
jgi:hypothetical protein